MPLRGTQRRMKFVGAGLVPARAGAGQTAKRAGTSPAPTFLHPVFRTGGENSKLYGAILNLSR